MSEIKVGLEYVGFVDCWTGEERLTDEEIVRCRDCKLSRETEHDPKERWCHKSSLLAVKVSDDGFCAWGKVRVGSSRFE